MLKNDLALDAAIDKTVLQFTKLNPTVINSVNKQATTMETFKTVVYRWLAENIPEEFHDECYRQLCAAAWDYDILHDYIWDDGTISDIACHDWNNVWIMKRGKWEEAPWHFRSPEHYSRFFLHACTMNNVMLSRATPDTNTTDVTTCPDFRMRLNFIHREINTDGTNVFSIRKIPTKKKTLDTLCEPQEGMLTPELAERVRDHLKDATGIIICGIGGSGKTTFLNALIEEFPLDWKYLCIQENEELYSYTHKNGDFIKTIRPINPYAPKYDLRDGARNGLLMSIKLFIIGETKGAEALDLFTIMTNGALGVTTLHTYSSRKGLEKMAQYIKFASDYSMEQCIEMLTICNKVFFLDKYRLREITTVNGYNVRTGELDMETEYYDPDNERHS